MEVLVIEVKTMIECMCQIFYYYLLHIYDVVNELRQGELTYDVVNSFTKS